MNHQANTKDTHSKKPLRAVCYVRVASTHDQDSTTAVDAQREACERKAQELGATIVDVYADVGSTGNVMQHRPSLRAMLARLESDPHISCIITYDHARLARNIDAYRKIVRALENAGVELVTVKESGGPHFQEFMRTITEAMAELDVQHRREARRARRAAS